MLIQYLLTMLGLRFLLFDHKHTRRVRDFICKKSNLLCYLAKCSYCQGFQSGMATCWIYGIYDFRLAVQLCFAAAITSLIYTVLFDEPLSNYERKHSGG